MLFKKKKKREDTEDFSSVIDDIEENLNEIDLTCNKRNTTEALRIIEMEQKRAEERGVNTYISVATDIKDLDLELEEYARENKLLKAKVRKLLENPRKVENTNFENLKSSSEEIEEPIYEAEKPLENSFNYREEYQEDANAILERAYQDLVFSDPKDYEEPKEPLDENLDSETLNQSKTKEEIKNLDSREEVLEKLDSKEEILHSKGFTKENHDKPSRDTKDEPLNLHSENKNLHSENEISQSEFVMEETLETKEEPEIRVLNIDAASEKLDNKNNNQNTNNNPKNLVSKDNENPKPKKEKSKKPKIMNGKIEKAKKDHQKDQEKLDMKTPAVKTKTQDMDHFNKEDKVRIKSNSEKTEILAEPSKERKVKFSLINKATGEVIEVRRSVFRIGKDKDFNDYVVEDNKTVSRKHIELISKNSKVYIKDLHSTNGTFIDGFRLPSDTELELKNGQKVVLSNEEFRVEM